MTIMLELNPTQEARLRDQAEALGLAPTDFLKRVAGLDNPPELVENRFAGKTLADVLVGSIGTVDNAPLESSPAKAGACPSKAQGFSPG